MTELMAVYSVTVARVTVCLNLHSSLLSRHVIIGVMLLLVELSKYSSKQIIYIYKKKYYFFKALVSYEAIHIIQSR